VTFYVFNIYGVMTEALQPRRKCTMQRQNMCGDWERKRKTIFKCAFVSSVWMLWRVEKRKTTKQNYALYYSYKC